MSDIRPPMNDDTDSEPGEHCLHWQEGDDDCHKCGISNWCPDDGVPAEMDEAVLEAHLAPVSVCRPGEPWDNARTVFECELHGHPAYGPVAADYSRERCVCGEVYY